MLRRLLGILIMTIFCASAAWTAKPRDIRKVTREKQAAERRIREASEKITANERDTKKNLRRLDNISAEMSATDSRIASVKAGIDSLNTDISLTDDSLRNLRGNMNRLQSEYVRTMRALQTRRRDRDAITFILSAPTFADAMSGMRRMRRLDNRMQQQSRILASTAGQVEQKHQSLNKLQSERSMSLDRLNTEQRKLEQQRKETDRVVRKLKSDKATLTRVLKENRERMKSLDRELNRLIEAEQERQAREERRKRQAEESSQKNKTTTAKDKDKSTTKTTKPATATGSADADRRLTGSFESNKGRLLFPVSGSYRIARGFGRQKHPELDQIETENNGVDIAVSTGTRARAVFDGKVSAIFQQPGFGNIVMIRHGNYLTVYANLASLSVKNGDTVKSGQTIGTIAPDIDDPGRALLHFELRREREKLNPMLWVK